MPPGSKLVGLHLLYRNDLPEGFGVGLTEEVFADDPKMEEMLCTSSQISINEYNKLPTDRERQEFIADIQSQFNELCKWFRERKGREMDEDWIAYFVILLDDMTFLQSIALFPNDEYNGVLWTWFGR